MNVEKMTFNDAKDVAKIHTLAWQYAYKNIINQNFLDSIDILKREENWKEGIKKNNPPAIRLVLKKELEVIGFACGLENRFKELVPNCDSELWAIYLNPNIIGSGYGLELLKAFREELIKLNKKSFCVWTLKENTIARKFYEKNNGKLTGSNKTFKIDYQELEEVCYLFKL